MKKQWWKSRTLWVNTALAMGAIAEANFGVIASELGPRAYLGGLTMTAGINCVLRFMTSQAIVDAPDTSAEAAKP